MIGLLVCASAPALAADRTYSVTSFDRIRVEGPFVVTVTTGKGVSAKATGTPDAFERVQVRVDGRTLLVRPNMSGWGGYPGRQSTPARIILTTPELHTAALLGSGSLDVDRMKGARATLSVEGSGRMRVAQVDVDNISLAISGSGGIEIAGRAKMGVALARGAAEIRAGDLSIADLTLTTESAGAVTMKAMRSARVTATGLGPVQVGGTAACEVKKRGAGPIVCGK